MISTHVLNRRGKSRQEAGVALLGAYLPLKPTAWPCGRGGVRPHPPLPRPLRCNGHLLESRATELFLDLDIDLLIHSASKDVVPHPHVVD